MRGNRMDSGLRILPLSSVNILIGSGWAGKGQGNFFLGMMGNYPWRRMNPNWSAAWRCGKETGILSHPYFPRKDLKYYIKKEEDKWTPEWWNTSKAFCSTRPELLKSSTPINQSPWCPPLWYSGRVTASFAAVSGSNFGRRYGGTDP